MEEEEACIHAATISVVKARHCPTWPRHRHRQLDEKHQSVSCLDRGRQE